MLPCLHRRDFLRFGTVTLGALAWPEILAAAPGRGRARACILLYMDGGPSHFDLWDMKPDTPAEVRGPFRPIATSLPGVRVCEHLPHTAKQMHRLTQVRSVRHTETVHDPAVFQMLTGRKHISSAGNLTVQPSDFPHMGTAFGFVDRRPAVMPKVIELPETMRMEARILPGQNAGFLGATHDPFRIEVTREGRVVPPPFDPRNDVPTGRLTQRASLLHRSTAGSPNWIANPQQWSSIAFSSRRWNSWSVRKSAGHSSWRASRPRCASATDATGTANRSC